MPTASHSRAVSWSCCHSSREPRLTIVFAHTAKLRQRTWVLWQFLRAVPQPDFYFLMKSIVSCEAWSRDIFIEG